MAKYTDEQRKEYVDLAQEVGINRARRELGYPSTWVVGKKWCDDSGIVIPLDEIKARAAAHAQYYNDEDLLMANQDLVLRAQELMQESSLTAPELEKLANTIKKASDTIRTIQGKDTKTDSTDKNIEQLLTKFDEVKSD